MIKIIWFIILSLLWPTVISYGGSTVVEPHIKQYYQVTDFAAVGAGSVINMIKYPNSNFSMQVTADGTVTDFAVDVETTLDCDDTTTFTNAATLSSGQGDAIDDIISITGYPARCVRVNVTSLTLGTATKITVFLLAVRDH